jgi:hypothetical protein
MVTIFEAAKAYQPPQTLNIADLNQVSIHELQILEKDGKNAEGEVFTYKYTIVEGKEYRIPSSVLEEIQTIIKLKPDVKIVRVKKSGTGLATRYKVDVIS